MIDFIIVDSELNYHNIYQNIIKKIMSNTNILYNIYKFTNINKELQNKLHDKNNYKIYLLDICLNSKKSGIDIINKIRNEDLKSEIIVVTSHDVMFETIFRTCRKIYYFIEKYYNMEDRLKNELKTIINNYNITNKFFSLDKNENLKISLDEILYIYRETSERKLYIVTNTKKYPVRLSIKEALIKCDDNFKQIHRACIVNINKVKYYNWQENYFILNNKEKVFMCSKTYKNNIV